MQERLSIEEERWKNAVLFKMRKMYYLKGFMMKLLVSESQCFLTQIVDLGSWQDSR